jgi:hypothetical protein
MHEHKRAHCKVKNMGLINAANHATAITLQLHSLIDLSNQSFQMNALPQAAPSSINKCV